MIQKDDMVFTDSTCVSYTFQTDDGTKITIKGRDF